MPEAIQAGRDAVAPMIRKLIEGAIASGDPVAFWRGAVGLIAGASAGTIGIPAAIQILQILATDAATYLGKEVVPAVELTWEKDGTFIGSRTVITKVGP